MQTEKKTKQQKQYLTCVQTLTQFFNLIGGARLPVDPLCVEAVHLNVVDEFFHQLRHRPLLAGQPGQLYAKLPRRQLWIKLVLEHGETRGDIKARL